MIVFFKQKTAYEMRSSDWSSDVCSSDLIRHGYKLGLNGAFFYKLVAPLAEIMGGAYPELNDKRELIEKTIRAEEDSFAITLDKGMKLLEEAIARLSDKTIPGDRSEEHTSELQSLVRISYAVFCLKKQIKIHIR